MEPRQTHHRVPHPKLADVAPEHVIDKGSPIPLHYQLERFLREGIEQGRFGVNETLPTEQELQEHFGLSRTPVRQALSKLVSERFVVRRRSQGTVVLPKPFEEQLQSLSSFTEEVLRRGQTPRTQMIEFTCKPAEGEVLRQLGLSPRSEVFHIVRVRMIDDQPVGVVTSQVPVAMAPGLRCENFQEYGHNQSIY